MYNFDPYIELLAIATNIPVLLMTAFVLQGHKYVSLNSQCFIINPSDYSVELYSCLWGFLGYKGSPVPVAFQSSTIL